MILFGKHKGERIEDALDPSTPRQPRLASASWRARYARFQAEQPECPLGPRDSVPLAFEPLDLAVDLRNPARPTGLVLLIRPQGDAEQVDESCLGLTGGADAVAVLATAPGAVGAIGAEGHGDTGWATKSTTSRALNSQFVPATIALVRGLIN